uniref:Uncharacterized protein n=1 Tax=Ditylenchus dipsaci TaxID=166011 RepID=A0A915D9V8_9BILA
MATYTTQSHSQSPAPTTSASTRRSAFRHFRPWTIMTTPTIPECSPMPIQPKSSAPTTIRESSATPQLSEEEGADGSAVATPTSTLGQSLLL